MKTIKEIPITETIPLWARWNRDALLDRLKEIGETAFNRGYRNIAYADDDLMFREIDKAIIVGRTWKDYVRASHPIYAGVDLAGDKRKGNAIVIIGVEPGTQIRTLIDVHRGAWKSTEVADRLVALHDGYKFNVVKVENNAYQQSIIDWMTKSKYQAVPISAHTTGMNKSHPEFGLPSMAVELERGMWRIPREKEHAIDCQCGVCSFLSEARSYPLGKDADTVMAWWFAREAIGGSIHNLRGNTRHGSVTEAGLLHREKF